MALPIFDLLLGPDSDDTLRNGGHNRTNGMPLKSKTVQVRYMLIKFSKSFFLPCSNLINLKKYICDNSVNHEKVKITYNNIQKNFSLGSV